MAGFFRRLFTNELAIFIIIFALALIFYIQNIGLSDLWSDEIYTKSMLTGNLSDFYSKFRNDLHPPLYFIGLRLFTSVFGLSATSLRMFSVSGVLATICLGYFAGRRVFGKQGALIFSMMLIAVPMTAVYSHQARMYTWAEFTVTGVFIYSLIYLKTGFRRDLVFLFIFTLAAMYTHYYSLIAALVANTFVFSYLVLTKNNCWKIHLGALILAVILFLPWVAMFFVQIKRVQHAFWAPPVSFQTIMSCFAIPFTEQFWTTNYSKAMTIMMYLLITIAIGMSFLKSFSEYRLVIWLSVAIFIGTLFIAMIISFVSQPIFYNRYVATIVTMLTVPVTVLLMSMKIRWMNFIIIPVILFLGIRISISANAFSYGPYKQTVDYLSSKYPDIKKLLHITEVTAGPMIEYNGNSGLEHYWLRADMSNVDAFTGIHQFSGPEEFLQKGEKFCVVQFNSLELNKKNLDHVLSQSDLIKKDTVFDNKFKYGIYMQLYLLRFRGNDTISNITSSRK